MTCISVSSRSMPIATHRLLPTPDYRTSSFSAAQSDNCVGLRLAQRHKPGACRGEGRRITDRPITKTQVKMWGCHSNQHMAIECSAGSLLVLQVCVCVCERMYVCKENTQVFRQSQYCTRPSLVRSVCTYQSVIARVPELPLVLFNPIASRN